MVERASADLRCGGAQGEAAPVLSGSAKSGRRGSPPAHGGRNPRRKVAGGAPVVAAVAGNVQAAAPVKARRAPAKPRAPRKPKGAAKASAQPEDVVMVFDSMSSGSGQRPAGAAPPVFGAAAARPAKEESSDN
eukprot:GEMP01094204.1.p2 GENE.GEMP01094204.1~~GEMP01094204.1.p2  ORF type:complete len:133 (+),score=44.86 GEMP01094204.1:242-640(+)